MELPPLPPKLPVLPPLYVQTTGRAERQPRVLAAEDIPGYYEFRGWLKAQQQLSDEGVLMSYQVGHARLAAVEARRIANECLPFTRIGPVALLPLPPRLPCLPK